MKMIETTFVDSETIIPSCDYSLGRNYIRDKVSGYKYIYNDHTLLEAVFESLKTDKFIDVCPGRIIDVTQVDYIRRVYSAESANVIAVFKSGYTAYFKQTADDVERRILEGADRLYHVLRMPTN